MAVSAVAEKAPSVVVEVPSVAFALVAVEEIPDVHTAATHIDDVVVQLSVLQRFLQQPQRVFLQVLQSE